MDKILTEIKNKLVEIEEKEKHQEQSRRNVLLQYELNNLREEIRALKLDQQNSEQFKRDRRATSDTICYACHRYGHYARDCPYPFIEERSNGNYNYGGSYYEDSFNNFNEDCQQFRRNRRATTDISCYTCHRVGHYAKDCQYPFIEQHSDDIYNYDNIYCERNFNNFDDEDQKDYFDHNCKIYEKDCKYYPDDNINEDLDKLYESEDELNYQPEYHHNFNDFRRYIEKDTNSKVYDCDDYFDSYEDESSDDSESCYSFESEEENDNEHEDEDNDENNHYLIWRNILLNNLKARSKINIKNSNNEFENKNTENRNMIEEVGKVKEKDANILEKVVEEKEIDDIDIDLDELNEDIICNWHGEEQLLMELYHQQNNRNMEFVIMYEHGCDGSVDTNLSTSS